MLAHFADEERISAHKAVGILLNQYPPNTHTRTHTGATHAHTRRACARSRPTHDDDNNDTHDDGKHDNDKSRFRRRT